MKKISRNPMRPEHEPGAQLEIWQPTWKCFCCHDSGIVVFHLAKIAIEGFNFNRDKLPRCQNPGCEEGSHWDGDSVTHCVDYRLTPAICQELDSIERSNWRRTTEFKRQQILERIAQLSQNKSIRQGERTPEEETSASQKHAAVLASWGLEAQNDSERKWLASRSEVYE